MRVLALGELAKRRVHRSQSFRQLGCDRNEHFATRWLAADLGTGVVWFDTRPAALSPFGVLVERIDGAEPDLARLRAACTIASVDLRPAEGVILLERLARLAPLVRDELSRHEAGSSDCEMLAMIAKARLRFACALAEGSTFADAAAPLIGLGPGLTPSEDDFLGGYALTMMAANRMEPLEPARFADWLSRTGPISAEHLAAHLSGQGARGELAFLSAAAAGDEALLSLAARQLFALGHSSGRAFCEGALLAAEGFRP